MTDFGAPRRFNRLFEMDRNGPPMSGTLEEQKAVRDAIDAYVMWDNPFDRVLFALTKQYKSEGRLFVPISFFHEERASFYGRTGGASIQLFPPSSRAVEPTELAYVLTHEIGHLVGMKLFNPGNRSEQWAADFQWWIMNGMMKQHNTYRELIRVGAQESVVIPS